MAAPTASLPQTQVAGAARWRVYLALIVAALLWASLYPAAKPAVAASGPLQVTFCRVLLAFMCLALLIAVRSGTRDVAVHLRAHWRAVVVLGLGNFAASQVLAMLALVYLPASVNGLLNNTHPLWVAIGTALFFQPARPALLVIGSAVALLGVALVFLPSLPFGAVDGPPLSTIGVALSLAGSAVIAIGTGIGRRVMPGSSPLMLTMLACGVAVLPMMLLVLANGGFEPILSAPADVKLLLLYVGVGCTAVNYVLWYYGLKHLNAAAASGFQYVIPPMSVILAAVFLHEALSMTLLLGGAFILLGLLATQVATDAR
ncbi:MAG TPA: DMT family transporter [Chloroflexota bacterium]|jgi:drug/metabolite transporter (DMT)-like permease|nr:DMT family transporter [Chloroflexota bacterium]